MISILFFAALTMAQTTGSSAAPAVQQPAAAQVPVAKKQKPKQICEMIDVTGSRARRRVCRDDSGNLDLGPGIKSTAYDNGTDGQRSNPQ